MKFTIKFIKECSATKIIEANTQEEADEIAQSIHEDDLTWTTDYFNFDGIYVSVLLKELAQEIQEIQNRERKEYWDKWGTCWTILGFSFLCFLLLMMWVGWFGR